MTEEDKLRTALQKIADLPATQQGNRANPMLRAKRIAMGALGANQKAIQKFNDDKRTCPPPQSRLKERDRMRWAVKAKDGWHFAKPNRFWKDGENHIKTQCGSIVTLPFGCDRRSTVDCDDCHLAVENKN